MVSDIGVEIGGEGKIMEKRKSEIEAHANPSGKSYLKCTCDSAVT